MGPHLPVTFGLMGSAALDIGALAELAAEPCSSSRSSRLLPSGIAVPRGDPNDCGWRYCRITEPHLVAGLPELASKVNGFLDIDIYPRFEVDPPPLCVFLGVVEVDISVASHQPLLLNGRSVTSVAAMRQQGREFLGWDHCLGQQLSPACGPTRPRPTRLHQCLASQRVGPFCPAWWFVFG